MNREKFQKRMDALGTAGRGSTAGETEIDAIVSDPRLSGRLAKIVADIIGPAAAQAAVSGKPVGAMRGAYVFPVAIGF